MKNLVYIASGRYDRKYENFPYDRIFLVDNAIRNVFSEKVVCLRMDALDSVEYFQNNNIAIDCLVTLRESQGEGGFTYNMCSDLFLGYMMKVLAKEFIWVCNGIEYYSGLRQSSPERPAYTSRLKLHDLNSLNFVSLNLPYEMKELHIGDEGYISPSEFTSLQPERNCHVYKMTYKPIVEEIILSGKVTIRIIQDSIWLHEHELDQLFVSFRPSYSMKQEFFTGRPNVSYYKQMQFYDMLKLSATSGYTHIGFTPHYWYQYDRNYKRMLEDFLREFKGGMMIDFYYLNSWFHCNQIKKAIKTIQREKLLR